MVEVRGLVRASHWGTATGRLPAHPGHWLFARPRTPPKYAQDPLRASKNRLLY